MGKFQLALKKALAILKDVKLTKEQLIDKSIIQYDTDEITKGEVVYLCDGADDYSVLPDGKYETLSQLKFTIENGIVSDVNATGEIQAKTSDEPILQLQQSADTPAEAVVEPVVLSAEPIHLDIAEPGAGASEDLLNPTEDMANQYAACMAKLSEVQAQHGVFQSHHDSLRAEHDGIIKRINKLEELYATATAENIKLSKQIDVLNKKPAATVIEEVKGGGFANVSPDVAKTKAYKMFNETD